MKIILAMVMSLDGKTTRWDGDRISRWTSKEDQAHFFALLEKHEVIIMGRKTFEAVKSAIKLSPEHLRVVITHTPEKYSEFIVGNQLEFTKNLPFQLLEKLKRRGYNNILLVGGEQVNTSFFKEKLIDELWLTVEPVLFGNGNSLLSTERLHVSMKLKEIQRLNKKGTLLLKYEVLK